MRADRFKDVMARLDSTDKETVRLAATSAARLHPLGRPQWKALAEKLHALIDRAHPI